MEQLASFMRLRHIFISSSSVPLSKSGNKQHLQKIKNRKLDLVKLHMSIVPVIGFVELLGGETDLVGCIRTVCVEASFVLL